MRSKYVCAAALCLLVALGFGAAAFAADAAAPEKPPVIGVGGELRDFTLKKIDGTPITFSKDIKGKTKATAINFSNTACAACLSETRVLNDIAKENPDLSVYTIMVDARGAQAAKQFKEQYGLANMLYLLDPEFSLPPLYGYNYTPALLVVDKNGKILISKGGFNSKELDAYVKEIKATFK